VVQFKCKLFMHSTMSGSKHLHATHYIDDLLNSAKQISLQKVFVLDYRNAFKHNAAVAMKC